MSRSSVARKLCTELIAAEPLTEIMALVADCFSAPGRRPRHIVVRINDPLYDDAREHIEKQAKQAAASRAAS